MFPWPATCRLVRANAWAALFLAFLLFIALMAKLHI